MSDDLERRLQEVLEERGAVAPTTVTRVVAGIGRLPDRRRRRRIAALAAAAAAVILVALAVSATLVVSPRPPAVLTPSPSATPQATLQIRPVWAIDLASHLDCAGPVSTLGSERTIESAASPDVASLTPDAAFEATRHEFPMLPSTGYSSILIDDHWALQRYLVDGRPKVHMVATDQPPGAATGGKGWRVVGVRMCDPSEF